jgi:hypothetical protein
MAETPSLDTCVRTMVREAIAEEIRAALAPVRTALEALTAASPPALIDLAEAHRRGLITSLASGRRLAASGGIPARRIGKKWMVDVVALKPVTDETVARLAEKARR